MATVTFSSELQQYTQVDSAQISALNYRDMIRELNSLFPLLSQSRFSEMAVAIDDVIIVDPLLEELSADSEVFFFHFVAGG